MTEAEAVEAAVDAAAEAGGGLRISICCAGIGWAERTTSKHGPHTSNLPERLEVNLIGTFNVLRLAATAMPRTSPTRAASAASSSTPRRSPPSTARSARSPTRPPRAASSG